MWVPHSFCREELQTDSLPFSGKAGKRRKSSEWWGVARGWRFSLLMQMCRPSKLHTIHHISFGRVDPEGNTLCLLRYIFLFLYFAFRLELGFPFQLSSVQFLQLPLLPYSDPGQIGGPTFNGLCDKRPSNELCAIPIRSGTYVPGFVCPICSQIQLPICAHINKVTLEPLRMSTWAAMSVLVGNQRSRKEIH